MSKEKKVTQTEINKRIKAVTMEAEFRFKCLELASNVSKKIDDLIENATTIYNYSFHIDEDAMDRMKKEGEDESSSN
tara:strand:- start:16 stop:246 length:231 start_codon:yes stop_codon:yes gene_type:complete